MNSQNEKFGKIKLTGVADQIFEILRERIIGCDFKPNEKLDIQNLADEFETSPMPIRDALKRCADEGLVKIVPRVGYYVAKFDEKEINEIFDLRKLLEIRALELGFTRINEGEILQLKEDLESLKNEDDKAAFIKGSLETDVRLHSIIINSSGNSRLKMFAWQINGQVDIIRNMSTLKERGVDDHLKIISAILQKDLPLSKKLLAEHIENGGKAAILSLAEDSRGHK